MSDSNIPSSIRPDKYSQRTLTLEPWASCWLPCRERRWDFQRGTLGTAALIRFCILSLAELNSEHFLWKCPFDHQIQVLGEVNGQWGASWELRFKSCCWHRALGVLVSVRGEDTAWSGSSGHSGLGLESSELHWVQGLGTGGSRGTTESCNLG